ncbi:MAG: hypothetical protein A3E57_00585 [Candidatus Muproteobacteria bacterium RIFCSPHIGHO2_12_FULL_60_33]|uniref:Calcineurin-like phosphoesterase domain-containing protein n=1 Tax=Candidatus Muproteobacteria bacterium RIFCSPLOWO2_01_FULL_60_18 TaxID=1817768 RepID=A0A1F6U5Y2_9PROT|nr:MAG: hypothetical protein A3A87_02675 [Candidatus Muproteobacteria bacterium RIFCSPLOWO2_01_FULL_60_18]OGI55707.1 MAG: hypothetical protein A3E57_00585 [Candidatus Muproteobacteria bacterium RIFCSPHIGHO2_12_FULL_60_33]OGI56233.1 MAG: hypothetical protein A3D32_01515 [Candidatus Muproteobacteria bacterium RIFCSPHIGHO2_02_FULL_60_13]
MKICIVSDSHDHRDYLAAAVTEAKSLGAQAVIHCGDLVAPSTLHAIIPLGLPVHLVHGNNTGDLFHLSKLAHKPENRVHYYKGGETLRVDPGTVGGVSALATYILGDLEKMEFEIRSVRLPETLRIAKS